MSERPGTKCERCNGRGSWISICVMRTEPDGSVSTGPDRIPCFRCKQTGWDDHGDVRPEWIKAGAALRQARNDRNEYLRDAAIRLGISPVELSEMERGEREPSL